MGIFSKKYLSDEHMRGFANYKYSCIDSSPIAVYISHPFWDWFVQFYPRWVAPNLITLSGFAMVMGCYVIVSILDPTLKANSGPVGEDPLPNSLWLLCAFATFMAHLLDGTDGKQARRTGASGPTGELFDHGLDSWATVPFTITIFSVFGRDQFSVNPVHLLCVLISVQLVFITTHWEKYNTGVLFLSWGYDGLSLFYLLTYFLGFQWYKFYVIAHYSFADIFEIGFYLCCVSSLIMSIYNMQHAYFIDKTGKQANLYEACLPMFPSVCLFTIAVYWALHSPNNVINVDPRFFFWTMGTIFANIACRLIIAQMTNTRAETFNALLLLYACIAGCSILGLFGAYELTILRLVAIFVTIAHIHYGACVVNQMCEHFGIQAFSLAYLQKRAQKEPYAVYELRRCDSSSTSNLLQPVLFASSETGSL